MGIPACNASLLDLVAVENQDSGPVDFAVACQAPVILVLWSWFLKSVKGGVDGIHCLSTSLLEVKDEVIA